MSWSFIRSRVRRGGAVADLFEMDPRVSCAVKAQDGLHIAARCNRRNMQRGVWQTMAEQVLDSKSSNNPTPRLSFFEFSRTLPALRAPKISAISNLKSGLKSLSSQLITTNNQPAADYPIDPTCTQLNLNNAYMQPIKEATMAGISASSSSGAAFVTPHKHRGSSGSVSSTSATPSSSASAAAATATPTPTRYLPLLREIQDVQETNAKSIGTSTPISDISTAALSTNAAPATVAASPTTNSTFFTGSSFGVF